MQLNENEIIQNCCSCVFFKYEIYKLNIPIVYPLLYKLQLLTEVLQTEVGVIPLVFKAQSSFSVHKVQYFVQQLPSVDKDQNNNLFDLKE